MHEIGEVDQDLPGLAAAVVQLLQRAQRAGHVALHRLLEKVDHPGAVGQPQHQPQRRRVERAARAGPQRDGLVEQAERVAHRALGGARDHRQRLLLHRHALLGADAGEVGHHHLRLDPAQVEALGARAHRHRHLLDLGGGEQELDVVGRLFQRLQQAVEGLLREHVHLVDDVDLGARHHRPVARGIDDLAHVVDAGVAGGVHLDDVDVAALDDGLAVHPVRRHVDRRPGDAVGLVVEGPRQDARRGGLAHAAHAGQHVGLVDAVEVEGVGQGPHHGVLPDEVVERRRPVLSRQHAIGLGPGRVPGRVLGRLRLVGEELAEPLGRAGIVGKEAVAHEPVMARGRLDLQGLAI